MRSCLRSFFGHFWSHFGTHFGVILVSFGASLVISKPCKNHMFYVFSGYVGRQKCIQNCSSCQQTFGGSPRAQNEAQIDPKMDPKLDPQRTPKGTTKCTPTFKRSPQAQEAPRGLSKALLEPFLGLFGSHFGVMWGLSGNLKIMQNHVFYVVSGYIGGQEGIQNCFLASRRSGAPQEPKMMFKMTPRGTPNWTPKGSKAVLRARKPPRASQRHLWSHFWADVGATSVSCGASLGTSK